MAKHEKKEENKTGIPGGTGKRQARPDRKQETPPRPPGATHARPRPRSAHRPRPVSYEPAFATELYRLMAEGYSVTAVAGKLGVDIKTIARWMRQHPDFRRAVELGEGARVFHFEDLLRTAKSMKDARVAMRTLEIAAPDEWDRKRARPMGEFETKDPDDTGLRVIILPAKELEARYEAQIAKEEE